MFRLLGLLENCIDSHMNRLRSNIQDEPDSRAEWSKIIFRMPGMAKAEESGCFQPVDGLVL